ncbi:MAG: thiamine phosphate synthase [Vibrio sp.]
MSEVNRKQGDALFAHPLYLVTDDQQSLTELVEVVTDAVQSNVIGMVQIREKHGDVRSFIERAQAIKPILAKHKVPLIINDRVDVALAVDADGLHLGQSDMPVAMARKLLGSDKILGLSVETMAQLEEAQSMDLDYLGVSAIFATPTKTNTINHWGLDGLTQAVLRSRLPLVAIGGINQTNIAQVAHTKVASIALVSAICHAKSPRQASVALNNQIKAG